ncbi:MAG: cytochrome P450 [Mycobacteriaceae bacterium]|nr:cytochrome P450 [Mycobacteriaceae bacterium]
MTTTPAPAGSGLKTVRGDTTNMVLNTLLFRRNLLGECERLRREFGEVAAANYVGKRVVMAQGPEAFETVLMNRDRAFANGPAWGYFIGAFFNRGVMLLDGQEHLDHRRVMQLAFGRTALQSYLAAMQASIARQIANWAAAPDFPIQRRLKQLTLDTALDVFVGVSLSPGEARKVNTAFVDTVHATTTLIRAKTPLSPVPITAWDRGLAGRKLLEKFFRSHIPAKRRDGGDDIFARLCTVADDDGAAFTDDDVVNHMIFLLMAAHDTTTTTLSSMAYFLAKNPDWQQRARAEALAGPHAPTMAELDQFDVLDRCMKESLRMCAPVNGLIRYAVKDTRILGYHIPKDTFLILPTYANHLRSDVWPDPMRFDPDRYLPERREDKVHRMAWAPFGGGVHKCIGMYFGGMEAKTVFLELLRNFEWSVPPDYIWPLDLSALPVVRDGLPVSLVTRVRSDVGQASEVTA